MPQKPPGSKCAHHIAEYMILHSDNGLTPLHVNKLVFFSHGWSLALLDRPLIGETVEAWQYGPVVPSVYHAFKQYGGETIDGSEYFDQHTIKAYEEALAGMLDGDEKSIMDQVLDHYGGMTGPELIEITHRPGSPWAQCYDKKKFFSKIDDEIIKKYYRNLKEK